MLNNVILIGNLTRNIELRYLQNGTAIGKSAIAVTKKSKGQNGQVIENTMFIDLTFWGKTAEIASQYLSKGSKLAVNGEIVLDQWQDQQTGQNRQKHSIRVETMEMLGNPNNQNNGGNYQQNGGYNQNNRYSQNNDYNQNPQNNQNNGEYYQPKEYKPNYGGRGEYGIPPNERQAQNDKYEADDGTIPF